MSVCLQNLWLTSVSSSVKVGLSAKTWDEAQFANLAVRVSLSTYPTVSVYLSENITVRVSLSEDITVSFVFETLFCVCFSADVTVRCSLETLL